MKHKKLTIANGQIYEATHNHDSLGQCLGHVVSGATIEQVHGVIDDVFWSNGHRVERLRVMVKALRDAGVIV